MTNNVFNLASRPFSNQAPVLRIAILLGIVALGLTAFNINSYWSFFSGAGQEAREQLQVVDREIRSLDAELVKLRRELGDTDFEDLNRQVAFLNLRIAERTFGWSELFEDLGEVLPHNVRLQRLSPRIGRRGVGGRVELTLQGYARTEDGLLDLIDRMFAHERFSTPSPGRQSRREGQQQFTLTVVYEPGASRDSAAPEPTEEGEVIEGAEEFGEGEVIEGAEEFGEGEA